MSIKEKFWDFFGFFMKLVVFTVVGFIVIRILSYTFSTGAPTSPSEAELWFQALIALFVGFLTVELWNNRDYKSPSKGAGR